MWGGYGRDAHGRGAEQRPGMAVLPWGHCLFGACSVAGERRERGREDGREKERGGRGEGERMEGRRGKKEDRQTNCMTLISILLYTAEREGEEGGGGLYIDGGIGWRKKMVAVKECCVRDGVYIIILVWYSSSIYIHVSSSAHDRGCVVNGSGAMAAI